MKYHEILKDLLTKGYFPEEVPSPFNTLQLGDILVKDRIFYKEPFAFSVEKGPTYRSQPSKFNFCNVNRTRRVLSCINPINYFQLANLIAENWTILNSYFDKGNRSISKPIYAGGRRPFDWARGMSEISTKSLKIRDNSQFILKADISGFYPNIYTHSIPWALHTKKIAKNQRKYSDNLGNKIDKLVSHCQAKQTKGIPIGPDTSFIIAEVIATGIDSEISKEIQGNYLRFIDDISIGCRSFDQAEETKNKLENILSVYELSLNNNKTEIYTIDCAIEPGWKRDLRAFDFSSKAAQSVKLFYFFDTVMDNLNSYPKSGVLKYAIKKLSSQQIKAENWHILESMLLQWITLEASTLPIVVDMIKLHSNLGLTIDFDKVKNALESIIEKNISCGHTSEVVWSLWGMILLNIKLSPKLYSSLCAAEDPFIALLCLDAKSKEIINSNFSTDKWGDLISEEELRGQNWLLVYEAMVKKWLPSKNGKDFLKTAPGFSDLYAENCEFYDSNWVANYNPGNTLINTISMYAEDY